MKLKKGEKICIVCQRIYPCYIDNKRSHGGSRVKTKRGSNYYTCSMKCSKIYTRVYDRIQKRMSRWKK